MTSIDELSEDQRQAKRNLERTEGDDQSGSKRQKIEGLTLEDTNPNFVQRKIYNNGTEIGIWYKDKKRTVDCLWLFNDPEKLTTYFATDVFEFLIGRGFIPSKETLTLWLLHYTLERCYANYTGHSFTSVDRRNSLLSLNEVNDKNGIPALIRSCFNFLKVPLMYRASCAVKPVSELTVNGKLDIAKDKVMNLGGDFQNWLIKVLKLPTVCPRKYQTTNLAGKLVSVWELINNRSDTAASSVSIPGLPQLRADIGQYFIGGRSKKNIMVNCCKKMSIHENLAYALTLDAENKSGPKKGQFTNTIASIKGIVFKRFGEAGSLAWESVLSVDMSKRDPEILSMALQRINPASVTGHTLMIIDILSGACSWSHFSELEAVTQLNVASQAKLWPSDQLVQHWVRYMVQKLSLRGSSSGTYAILKLPTNADFIAAVTRTKYGNSTDVAILKGRVVTQIPSFFTNVSSTTVNLVDALKHHVNPTFIVNDAGHVSTKVEYAETMAGLGSMSVESVKKLPIIKNKMLFENEDAEPDYAKLFLEIGDAGGMDFAFGNDVGIDHRVLTNPKFLIT